MGIIKLKRGNKTNFAALTLEQGEPAFVLDDKELYIGDGTGKVLINPIKTVAGKTGAVVLTKSDVGLSNVANESKETMFTSPALTGSPTAPTQNSTDATTKLATTLFVKTAVEGKTSVTGNAGTATKLANARNIILTGAVTGQVSFDGSTNVTIDTTNASTDVDGGTF